MSFALFCFLRLSSGHVFLILSQLALERKAWLEQEGSGEHGAQQRQRVVAVSVGPWSPGGGPGSQLSAGGQRGRVFAPAVAPRPPVLFSCADA